MVWIIFLEEFVNLHRSVSVFLIPPAGDIEIRNPWFREDVRHGLLFPEGVVIRMRNKVLPGWQRAVDVLFVGVRESAEAQIPFIGVELIELKCEIRFAGL